MEKRKLMDITIGSNMSKLRKQFNLTQREICSLVGVNTSTYKHYELGDRMVPISVLQDLAKFYKVSTNYFFENMPELSMKESIELSKYATEVSNSTQKYIAIDLKNPTKGLEELEKKIQVRARLRIKNLRLENNKSQKEIAKYLEVDLSTYNKYEKGSRKLSNEVVKKLAEYYNISVSDIVD
ncbi:MAG TPA: helix-turn-helix domain-containing protein [Bacilli bacterium]|nr:helix-turn-helix domain-containing protein [Bacilli bacterium]